MRRTAVALVCLMSLAMVGSAEATRPTSQADDALAAALVIFDGVPQVECDAGRNPEQKTCVSLRSSPETVARGVAVVGLAAGDGVGSGANGILGRTPELSWGYWFVTQNLVYQLLRLPGEMVVCGEGDGVNVREYPALDATILTALADFTRVQVAEFVLTEPGTPRDLQGEGRMGEGWYRLSAPAEGWASARYLSSTTVDDWMNQPPCSWRDAMESRR